MRFTRMSWGVFYFERWWTLQVRNLLCTLRAPQRKARRSREWVFTTITGLGLSGVHHESRVHLLPSRWRRKKEVWWGRCG